MMNVLMLLLTVIIINLKKINMNWKFKLLKLSTYNSLINQSMSKDIIISNQSKQLKDNIDKLKSLNVYLRLLEIDKIEAKSKSYQQITTLEEMICTLRKSNEKLKDKLSHKNQPRNKGKFTKKQM
mgnify:CR=1 FL=1